METLSTLDRSVVSGLRWTTPEQWHVTLRFLGEVDETAARKAFGRLGVDGSVVAEMRPATGRFGQRVLHVPVAGLEPLAAATVIATAGVGASPDSRPFSGHVTLARTRGRDGVDLRPLTGVALAGRWTVGEVSLVASHPGGHGPTRYEVLETVPL